jgi:hypothetical protein
MHFFYKGVIRHLFLDFLRFLEKSFSLFGQLKGEIVQSQSTTNQLQGNMKIYGYYLVSCIIFHDKLPAAGMWKIKYFPRVRPLLSILYRKIIPRREEIR